MKFSVNWLRDFVEMPSTIDNLAELLTLAGIEIEGIERRGAQFEKVVVAQITASAPHPNADRLSVCQVNDGSGQARQIVCGAKNYKVGDKVPLALPGAVLTQDLKIRSSKLRGVESDGMLCSGTELGLSQDSDGLLILSPEAPVGAPIGSLFPEDTILDVEITPNRGDLLSHFGLAREIAALTERKLLAPPIQPTAEAQIHTDAGVRISAPADCPYYSARRIEKVTIGPSPEWLRTKLESVGLRSINNVVDITNLVMLEFGQPLHAFDADKLTGGINVRPANQDEAFLALDGKTYSLGPDNLVIADDSRAVCIAGVMGGEDTGVTESTTNVLLESAIFRAGSVRQTARKLNLSSDSSYRFERGVDPALVLRASERATALIREFAAGTPSAGTAVAGQLPPPPKDVVLRYAQCARLIGLPIPREQVDQILERFGLQKERPDDAETVWSIPTYRSDLQREADLIEEVVRVFGIDKIPGTDSSRFTAESEGDRSYDFESDLRQRLIGRGLSEARTSALIPRGPGPFGEEALQLRNPLSEDHVALRPTLLSGLLDVLARNVRAGASSIRLFELGNTFNPENAKQKRILAMVFSGTAREGPHWRLPSRRLDLFDAKGVVEALGIVDVSFRRTDRKNLSVGADILSDSTPIGFLGQVSIAQAGALGAIAPVVVAEIELRSESMAKKHERFHEIDKFPAITRDIAMIVPKELSHAEIMTTIREAREPLLATIELFDVFDGKEAANLGEGKKSMAYTLTYRDKSRTLTNDEITAVHAKIRERLQRELGAELRE